MVYRARSPSSSDRRSYATFETSTDIMATAYESLQLLNHENDCCYYNEYTALFCNVTPNEHRLESRAAIGVHYIERDSLHDTAKNHCIFLKNSSDPKHVQDRHDFRPDHACIVDLHRAAAIISVAATKLSAR
jgi:hypothetical protein